MNWPQITIIVLMAVAASMSLAKHGQPREPHSFWGMLASIGIWAGLLYAGRFWG